MGFPERRPRRLRTTPAMRRLVAESRLSVDDLVAPLFVKEGIDAPEPVGSMPGVAQHTVASVTAEARALADLGVPALILFGVPEEKDARGSGADHANGIVQTAVRSIRDAVGDSLVIMTDDCLDEFTDHGHCGILRPDGVVDNDATLERYAAIASSQAAFMLPRRMCNSINRASAILGAWGSWLKFFGPNRGAGSSPSVPIWRHKSSSPQSHAISARCNLWLRRCSWSRSIASRVKNSASLRLTASRILRSIWTEKNDVRPRAFLTRSAFFSPRMHTDSHGWAESRDVCGWRG